MDFDEKSGTIDVQTKWGYWYQTVSEVVILVTLESGTTSKSINISIKPNFLSVAVNGNILISGKTFQTIYEDDSVWTIEDKKLLRICLSKADSRTKDKCWVGLVTDGDSILYQPDAIVLNEIRKKLDLERFQIENPGANFSNAKLDKHYEQKYINKAKHALDSNTSI